MAVDFAGEMKRAGALYRDWPENIKIVPELNGRHENTDIEALAADIGARGQLQPVGIRKDDDGQAVLVYGHRRWRALCLLNERNPEARRQIICTYAAMNDQEAFVAAIGENRFRKDVSPIDDAANIKVLRTRFGLGDDQIAKIYFPEGSGEEALKFVKQRAALIELSDEAAQAVREGRVKITAAVALAKLTKTQQRKDPRVTGATPAAKVPKPHRPTLAKNYNTLWALGGAVLNTTSWFTLSPEGHNAMIALKEYYDSFK